MPLFSVVSSDNEQEYGAVPRWLVACIAQPRFNFITQSLADIPAGTTVCVYDHWNPIGAIVLPATLRELVLYEEFGTQFVPNELPPSLQRLTLGEHFYRQIDPGVLPASLRQLRSRF